MFSSDILLIYYSLNWLFLSHFVKFKHFWASSCFCFGFSQCSFLWHTKPKTLNSSSRKGFFVCPNWMARIVFFRKQNFGTHSYENELCLPQNFASSIQTKQNKKTFLKPSTRMSSFTITRLKFPKYIFLCCS